MPKANQKSIEPEAAQEAIMEPARSSKKAAFVVLTMMIMVGLTYYSYKTLNQHVAQLGTKLTAISEIVENISSKQSQYTDTPVAPLALREVVDNTPSSASEKRLLALLVTAYDVQEAIKHSMPFDKELLVLAQAENPQIREKISIMTPYAPSGVKNIADLQKNFALISHAIEQASKNNAATGQGITGQLSSLIKIRKIDAVETSAAAMMAKAENAVAAADITGAISALRQIKDSNINKAMKDWLDDAAHFQEATESAAIIYQKLIAESKALKNDGKP